MTTIRHPKVVRKLILVSTPSRHRDIFPEFLVRMSRMSATAAKSMLDTPMYQFYASAAPHPEDWPTLVARVGALLRQEYDWSEQVASMTMPTLIVVGDSDLIHPTHAVELFSLLGGGNQAISPVCQTLNLLCCQPRATSLFCPTPIFWFPSSRLFSIHRI